MNRFIISQKETLFDAVELWNNQEKGHFLQSVKDYFPKQENWSQGDEIALALTL